MSRGVSKLDRMKRAAWVFARGGTWAEAAERAGVSQQSVSRYRQDPRWDQILEDAKADVADAPVVRLVPPATSTQPDALPANWRKLSSLQLAMCAQPAVRVIRDAMTGADVTKAQLDTARWLVERLAIESPAEEEPEEITTAEDAARALADAADPRLLRRALELAEGGV